MIPYTDKAKKALNYANRLSRSSGCNYVGTEHILAGLLKEGTGVAAEVLTANNVELEALLKLIDEPNGRFKDHLANSLIREFIIFLSNLNPDMTKRFLRYKNKKKKKA